MFDQEAVATLINSLAVIGKVAGYIAIIVVSLVVAIYFFIIIRMQVRNYLFQQNLPATLTALRLKICANLRATNDKLSQEGKINLDTWYIVNRAIEKMANNAFLIEELENFDGIKIPSIMFKIFMDWEGDQQPSETPSPERRRTIKYEVLKKIKEKFQPDLEEYRRLRSIRDKINLNKIFISNH